VVGPVSKLAAFSKSSPKVPRKVLWAVLVLLISILVVVFMLQGPPGMFVCDKYASVKGSDRARGAKSSPFRSAQKLVDSLRPGQTGCLRAGKYIDGDKVLLFKNSGTAKARITLRSYPGERATIGAQVKVPDGVNYITVRNLTLDGTYGPRSNTKTNAGRYATEPSTFVHGDNTRWIANNITKRNQQVKDLRRTGVCFLIGGAGYGIQAENTLIKRNRIHGCGPMANQKGGPDNHGIYVSSSRRLLILNNKIYRNGERGIQLYPEARGTLVAGNTIRGNGMGIIFSGRDGKVSSGNVVRNNVIVNSRAGWNVYSNYNQTRLVGKKNRVYGNCFRSTSRDAYFTKNGGIGKEVGFNAYDNKIFPPSSANNRATRLLPQDC